MFACAKSYYFNTKSQNLGKVCHLNGKMDVETLASADVQKIKANVWEGLKEQREGFRRMRVYIHVTIEQSKNRNTDLRTALWRRGEGTVLGGQHAPAVKYLLGGIRLGAGSTNQDGHQYKTKFLFFVFFFFFCTLNPPIRSWWSSEGGGAGGVSISAIFFSCLDNIKFTEEEIKEMEEEEDTEG